MNDRLDRLQIVVAEARDEMEHCTCKCGCQYALHSRISIGIGICFSCRARHHIGGTPLTEEEQS